MRKQEPNWQKTPEAPGGAPSQKILRNGFYFRSIHTLEAVSRVGVWLGEFCVVLHLMSLKHNSSS